MCLYIYIVRGRSLARYRNKPDKSLHELRTAMQSSAPTFFLSKERISIKTTGQVFIHLSILIWSVFFFNEAMFNRKDRISANTKV